MSTLNLSIFDVPLTIRFEPGTAAATQPVVASCGSKVFVAWVDQRDATSRIYFNYSTNRGIAWQTADTNLVSNLAPASASIAPVIACNNNDVYVAFSDTRSGNSDIYLEHGRFAWSGTTGGSDARIDDAPAGNNGDFETDGIDGHYDIEIVTSRDSTDAFGFPLDPFGSANVSRVIVGGTIGELGIGTIGIAETIDVGNFLEIERVYDASQREVRDRARLYGFGHDFPDHAATGSDRILWLSERYFQFVSDCLVTALFEEYSKRVAEAEIVSSHKG